MNYSPPPKRLKAGARSRNRAPAASESRRAGARRGVQSQQRRMLSCIVSASQSNQFKDKLFFPWPLHRPLCAHTALLFPTTQAAFGAERPAGIKELLPLGLNRVSPSPEQAEEPKLSFAEEPGGAKHSNPLKFNRSRALALSGAVEPLSLHPRLTQRGALALLLCLQGPGRVHGCKAR